MYHRQNNTNDTNNLLKKLNDLHNEKIYTKQFLTDIFNSGDNIKIENFLLQAAKTLDKEEILSLIYKLNRINLNLLDVNFFKFENLDLILVNLKKFTVEKLFEIFNIFIINHEFELKIKLEKSHNKIKLINCPTLNDYLIGMKIIKKPEKYDFINCLPSNNAGCIKKVDLYEDYNFINRTIAEIKSNKFKYVNNVMTKLIKFLNVSSKNLIITENQLCEIIRGLKKYHVQDITFITKLNYHGFVFAMDLMKEKFNIDCYSNYGYGVNKKLIDEDNGIVFEYMLKNNKINLHKLNVQFIFLILNGKKNNIINVLIKYKCDLSVQINNFLLGNYSYRVIKCNTPHHV
jgi:hypothetical protein